MSEHLFLGDTTYPHTPRLVERLRGSFTMSSYGSLSNMAKELLILTDEAAYRIEQLEQQLASIKQQFINYEDTDDYGVGIMIEYEKLKALIMSIKEQSA